MIKYSASIHIGEWPCNTVIQRSYRETIEEAQNDMSNYLSKYGGQDNGFICWDTITNSEWKWNYHGQDKGSEADTTPYTSR
jgi:hypothetical protein